MRAYLNHFFVSLFLLTGLFSKAQLTADFMMDRTAGCSPLSINFTNVSTGLSSNATFAWSFGNTNSSTLKNPSAIYTTEGTYTVTLTVTDGTQSATKAKSITVYKKPVVNFSTPAPKVCLPAGVQFTSTATPGDGTIINQQWDFGDGSIQQGFGSSIYYNYTYEQVATVSLTVTNSFGCVASITKPNIVEILPKLEPLFTVNKTLLCALSDSIVLTNTSTGPGPLQYVWNFGDGTTSTAVNPTHKYTTKGVYAVKLTVTNSVGCSATSNPVQINAAYFATDFTTRPLCREASFNATSYLYPSSSFWQFGDGGTQFSTQGALHIYAAAGTYNVTLINTYGACKDTVTKPATVQETVNFNSGITMPSAVCINNTASFTSTSSTAPSLIKWNFGDGTIYTTSSPSTQHTYSQPGTYTVTMINVFGTCSETITKTIVVNALPATTGFVVNYGGVCGSPVTVTFTDTTAGAVGWQWWIDNFYGTPFSTSQTASQFFASNGNHTVYLTVTNAAGCQRSVSKQITISSPSATIFYSQSSSPKGYYDCDSLTLKFTVNSNQAIQSYSWNLGNGTTSTSATPQVHYSQPGIYNVVLTYVTETGCTGIASFSPRVYDKPKANFTYQVPCGNSLDLQFTDTSPFSDDWNWNFGDGGLYYYLNPIHTYRDTGRYNVTFINHIGHCADTIVKQVYANVLPSSVSITKALNTCQGTRGAVTFDQRSVRASGGSWDFGDGTVIPYDSSAHNIIHTYTATGTYAVKLTSSYNNCTLIASSTVHILLKQSPSLSANKTVICASDALNVQIGNLQTNPFSGSFQYGQYDVTKFEYNTGAAYTGYSNNYYNWNYTNFSATLNGFTAGVTKMRAIINDAYTGCSDTTNYIDLQVNGPIVGFKVQNADLCFKSPFVFTDTSRSATTTPLTNWFWDFGDGSSQPNTTNAVVRHTYANPGHYTVTLRVTDATGCNASATFGVNAKGTKAAFTPSGLYIPNVPLNTTVTFYNNSNSYNTTPVYLWQYGDGSSSTAYTGSHTYPVAGTDTVKLIVSDPAIPCSDTAQKIITVKDFNTAFSFTTSFIGATSCPPVLVRITNLSVGFTKLLWDFGDGTTSTSTYYPSHIYPNPGVYRITLFTYGYNGLTGTYIDSIEVKKPSAQITADVLKGCLSQTVNLQAASQNANTYLWDFGDGVVNSTAAPLPHAYNSPGVYTPRLIIKDGNGCTASADLPYQIVIDSLAIKIQGIPPLICNAALIQFAPQINSYAASNLGTTLSYHWSFGTGVAADTANVRNPSFRYTQPSTYIVKLLVTSPYGCSKETTETIVVNQKATGSITGIPEVCQDGSILFAATASPTGNLQWSWVFGNGNTASVQNPPAQLYTTPGGYTVTMTVTKNGCIDTSTYSVTVHPKPVINALPREAILCKGASNTLSANGGAVYQWTPAIGLNNASIANPVASPLVTTLYQVQVTTAKGCSNKDSVLITVAQPIKVQLPATGDLCKGSSLQLQASGAAEYQWSANSNGLNTTSVANPVATPAATAIYTVVGTDTYHCFHDTASVKVEVHNLPSVSAGPDIEVQGNVAYQLSATGTSDVVTWVWSPADRLSCVDCPSPVVTPKMETLYTIKVSNQWGCTAMDTLLLKLTCSSDHVYIPAAFTPNGDGKNDRFYISGSGVKIIKYLRIYNRWGDVVFERTNIAIDDRSTGWDGKFNGQPLATGTYVYLAEMECSSGELFTRKGTVTLVQ